ncbi:MAG: hypothetical protein HOW73_35990 [Polyangiaceae bacterium]|nr:hypothetical protein [Polyangiaceae bacterium]
MVSMGPRVKGLTIRNCLAATEQLRGREACEQAVLRLEPEIADAVRYGGLVAGAWYPLAWQNAVLAALAAETHGGLPFLRQVGRVAVKLGLNSAHRVFVRVLGAHRSLAVSARFFNQHYERGTCEFLERRDGYARALWSGCDGFDANIWATVAGAAEGILESVEAENIRLHVVSGGGDRDGAMEAEARWN